MPEPLTPEVAVGARRAVALVRHYRHADAEGRDAVADEITGDPHAARGLIQGFTELVDALAVRAYGHHADQALDLLAVGLAAAEHATHDDDGGTDDD